ncbi:uncharacterized protein LOC124678414 isoform X2 [Lolium rigidum]|uniref:uncharacterized protein LOC124678414 isoform X2 n=1 Tax=Lolium rigidum TaxID=89674 RepID=UPI001F5E13CA|nr:uncharacterized protein LOC124678414 isoform X2 [Lolium rigidum]
MKVLHGYIMSVPRGCVKAHTDVDDSESEANACANYSLHLTHAIEVQPPFEWEGFAHIVLHCWLENEQPGRSSGSVKSEVEEQAPLLALLLHVAIRLLSDSDHTLRMVCMVAENLPSSNNSCVTAVSNSIRSSHGSPTVSNSIRSIQQLHDILSKIDKKCNFDEALRSIKLT